MTPPSRLGIIRADGLAVAFATFMGPLGIPELIFIFVLALLIFGPKKLPQLGKTFGKSMAEFRRASNDLRSTFQQEMDAIDRENQEVKNVAQEVQKDFDTSTYFEDKEEDLYEYDDTPYTEKSSASDSAAPKSSDSKSAQTTDDASGRDVDAVGAITQDETSAAKNDAVTATDVDTSEVKT